MINNIYYSAGSEAYLNNEIQNHPGRLLRLAESHDTADKYLLFDFADQDNILGDGIHLDTVYEVGNDNSFKGFIYCQAFDIPEERDDSLIEAATVALNDSIAQSANNLRHGFICRNNDHPRTIVMLTVWSDKSSLEKWLKSNEYASLDKFISHS